MDILVAIYNMVPGEIWLGLVGGPVASMVLGKLKKWLSLQSEKTVVFLLVLISLAEAVGVYIWHGVTQDPVILGQWTPIIISSALTFYHLIGKPALNLVKDAKALREAPAIGDAALLTKADEIVNVPALPNTQKINLPLASLKTNGSSAFKGEPNIVNNNEFGQ